ARHVELDAVTGGHARVTRGRELRARAAEREVDVEENRAQRHAAEAPVATQWNNTLTPEPPATCTRPAGGSRARAASRGSPAAVPGRARRRSRSRRPAPARAPCPTDQR